MWATGPPPGVNAHSATKVNGKYASATVLTNDLEDDSRRVLEEIMSQPFMQGQRVVVMPDVHYAGACVVGFTSSYDQLICPALVGADIGCGILAIQLETDRELSLQLLNQVVSAKVVAGEWLKKYANDKEEKAYVTQVIEFRNGILEDQKKIDPDEFWTLMRKLETKTQARRGSFGTLGSGNHFVELTEENYLLVHCGSRHLGTATYQYHQRRALGGAVEYNKEKLIQAFEAGCYDVPWAFEQQFKADLIQYLRDSKRAPDIRPYLKKIQLVPNTNPYAVVSDGYADQYLSDSTFCQWFAHLSRFAIVYDIIQGLRIGGVIAQPLEIIETVHNYVDVSERMIRKGAIEARAGQKVIIPLNSRDGILVAVGKARAEENYSAPHGAGRQFKRKDKQAKITMDKYKQSMKNVVSSSVSLATMDEAPDMYKPLAKIRPYIEQVVTIQKCLKTRFNFKSQ